MQRTYELKTDQTLETIKVLESRGIDRMAVILRHSERDFTDNPSHEPFMGLTDHGKSFAFDMGRNLPKKFKPRLFSSFFGRCIETAYLIDKGYSLEHGTLLDHNQTHELLAPFYIKDIEQAVTKVRKLGTRDFIRTWFDRKIDESVIILPEDTADMVCSHMVDRLKALDQNEMAVCVSHDWNLFPIKEFFLDQPFATHPHVGYMEAVILYESKGALCLCNHTHEPTPVLLDALNPSAIQEI